MKKQKLYSKILVLFLVISVIIIHFRFFNHPGPARGASTETLPILLGIYPGDTGQQATLDKVHALDSWAAQSGGGQTSFVGTSIDIDTPYVDTIVPTNLELIWQNGYTPLVQVGVRSSVSAYDIATGSIDAAVQAWARSFAGWASGGDHRMAFIALLPEMNSTWRVYAGDPANYIIAYHHIQSIFTQEGVTGSQVKWVFAPSTELNAGYPFKDYYPGDDHIDVLGLNAFNMGYCNGSNSWNDVETLLVPSILELHDMTMDKPVFVTQLGTTAQYPSQWQYDYPRKDQWLIDTYNRLQQVIGLTAILYVNYERECDWQVYQPDGQQYEGYRQVISSSRFGYLAPSLLAQKDLVPHYNLTYLPLAMNGVANLGGGSLPLLLGYYPQGFPGFQSVIDNELRTFDAWSGKQTSIVGLFISIEVANPDYTVSSQLETLWQNGYTGFFNLTSNHSLSSINNGSVDGQIRNLARAFASWLANGSGRKVFMAPFPEMNGQWSVWSGTGSEYRQAFARVKQIFTEQGVTPDSIWWVFAPNGYGQGQYQFENYYPGDSEVDVVGFSAYNWGYCAASYPWPDWQPPAELFSPYIQRMTAMAPQKPIFIIQTATTANVYNGWSDKAKDQWLQDAYIYLAAQPHVRAVMYFNVSIDCDWPIFNTSGLRYYGYPTGVSAPGIGYIAPINLSKTDLTLP